MNAHMHTVRRRTVHRETVLATLDNAQGRIQGEGSPHARLLTQGRHDPHIIAQAARNMLQHRKAWSINAIIIGQKDTGLSHQDYGVNRSSPPI